MILKIDQLLNLKINCGQRNLIDSIRLDLFIRRKGLSPAG